MIVSIDERLDNLDIAHVEDLVFEIYVNAKEIRKDVDIKTEILDNKFKNEINDFIKNKK